MMVHAHKFHVKRTQSSMDLYVLVQKPTTMTSKQMNVKTALLLVNDALQPRIVSYVWLDITSTMEPVPLACKIVNPARVPIHAKLAMKDTLIKYKMALIYVLKLVWEERVTSFYQMVKKPDALQVVHHVLKVN